MALRIAYFGLPLGALLLAEDGHEIELCVLSPVSAPGRRRALGRFGARVLDAAELGEGLTPRVDAQFAQAPPELLVSWFWTRKLPARWLELARFGAIGAHPSLLPRHRGPNPYFWAIDAGDRETGVTIHRLEAEYDTGAILEQERVAIGERNAWQLARALDRPSLSALRRVVLRCSREGLPAGRAQDPAYATEAPEPTGGLLRANFHEGTARVLRRIRALSPIPGLALSLEGLTFSVVSARPSADVVRALEPGEAAILHERLVLRTSDGALSVESAWLDGDDGDDGDDHESSGEALSGAALAHRLSVRLAERGGSSFKGGAG